VDIPALCDALASKHLAGAAIDVFPTEPATNSDPFNSPLCEFDNVILTPHIGGSTQEAQENIGLEVAGKLAKYSDNGSTLSAVNFPEVSLPLHGGRRLLHIHENRPGVLTAINQIFAAQGINIAAQYLQTTPQMGYVVIDIEAEEDVAQSAAGDEGYSWHHPRPSAVLTPFMPAGRSSTCPFLLIDPSAISRRHPNALRGLPQTAIKTVGCRCA
jgi:D-3-phosphoglycerate dehydrogenase